MPELLSPEGKLVEIPDQLTGQALTEQKFTVPNNPSYVKDGMVRMFDDSGQARLVPTNEVYKTLSAGWRLRSKSDDYQDFGSGAAAFGTGVAQSLIPFLGTTIMSQLGVPVEELEKYRPGLVTTGNITGAIGSMFVPGGQTTAIGKGLELLTAGPRAFSALGAKTAGEVGEILGNLASKTPGLAEHALARLGADAMVKAGSQAAGSAAEGALWALSYAVGEKSLGHPEDAAEGLLASVGPAALWGGVLGGVLGGGGVIFGRGMEKLASGAVKKLSDVADSAERQVLGFSPTELADITARAESKARAAGASSEEVAQAGSAEISRLFNRLTEADLTPDGALLKNGTTPQQLYKNVSTAIDVNGKRISGNLEKLDELSAKARSIQYETDAALFENTQQAAKRIGGETAQIGQPPASLERGEFDVAALKKTLQNRIDKIEKEGLTPIEQHGTKPYKELATFLEKSPKDTLTFREAQKMWVEYAGAFDKTGSMEAEAFNKARKDIWHIIRDQTLQDARKFTEKTGVGYQELAGVVRATDVYSDLIKLKKPLGKLANKISDAGELLQAVNSASSLWGRRISWGAGLGTASLIGGVPGIAVGMAATMAARAITPEASTIALTARKWAVNSTIQGKLGEVQLRLDQSIGKYMQRIFKGGKAVEKTVPPLSAIFTRETSETDPRKIAANYANQLDHLANNPQVMADNVSAALTGIQEHDPELTNAIVQKTIPIFKQLHADLTGTRPERDQLQPFLDDDTTLPSKAVADAALRKAEAVMAPLVTLDRAAAGHATSEELALVKTHYPRLWARYVFGVSQELAQQTERLPNSARQEIAALLGVPIDRPTSMDYIRRSQAAYKREGGEQVQGQAGPGNPDAVRTAQAKNLGNSFAAARRTGTQAIDAGLAGA